MAARSALHDDQRDFFFAKVVPAVRQPGLSLYMPKYEAIAAVLGLCDQWSPARREISSTITSQTLNVKVGTNHVFCGM